MNASEMPGSDAPREQVAPPAAETGGASESTAMPRWVKVLGGVIIALVVAVLAFHLSGNGMGGMHG